MYQLDVNQARKADATSSMINEIGKYAGAIEAAYKVTAKTGTKGVGFVFKADSGEKANFTLYTHKSNGEQIMGYESLMALMTVTKVRDIKPVAGVMKQWDSEQRKEVNAPVEIFPELSGKRLTILFQTEEYAATDGSVKRKAAPRYFLDAAGFSATEILDKNTEAKHGDQMLKSLRHRPIKGSSSATTSPQQSAGGGSGFDDMDDDLIPF